MFPPEPTTWGPVVWALHGIGILYVAGFFVAWGRFRRREKAIRAGSEQAWLRFNADLRRFPWSFYAKMLGRHVYVADPPEGTE